MNYKVFGLRYKHASSNITTHIIKHNNGPVYGAFPSNNWVEVYHETNDCNGSNHEHIGWWAHYAPGSGVWVNLGRTIITGKAGYGAACISTASIENRSTFDCNKCCAPAHKLLRDTATNIGYNSLQSCCGKRGGTGQNKIFEFAFFKPTCPSNKINEKCPRSLHIQSGRSHNSISANQLPATCAFMAPYN